MSVKSRIKYIIFSVVGYIAERLKMINNNELKKQCVKCQEVLPIVEFNKHSISRDGLQSYCRKCQSDYKYKDGWYKDNKEHIQEYTENKKEDTIYMFIDTFTDIEHMEEEGGVYYIGSTNYLNRRMSSHMTLKTKASNILKEHNKSFNVIYAEIPGKLNSREELYFIEYYLIHKYQLMFGDKPIGNDITTFNTNICTSRQFELILIAEGLKFKKYDVFKHKKNAFIS